MLSARCPTPHRYLLGDYTGGLHLLVLSGDAKDAQPVVQPLGRTSVAHSLSYLDSGVVFVGSRQGDSQLVRLLPEAPDASEPGNFVEVRGCVSMQIPFLLL